MEKDNDSWINDFVRAFGQSQQVSYEFRTQRDFVQEQNKVEDREQINLMNKDNQEGADKDESLNWQAEDEASGDKYVLELKRKQSEPDKKDIAITFSCINDSSKFVDSSLHSLCDGKYASYKDASLKQIAQVLCDDYDFIFNYVEASIAKYADAIDAEQAIKIASIAKNDKNMLSFLDYEKITSKLSEENIQAFNGRLERAGIKIYYPLNLIKVAGLQ